ncbi:cytochrome c maturation protein CcmE [Sphingomonas ginsenosidimutans]|uniref:Cytochrome c-type biogenesis protein CcmE n=1 Tax=Sphingomonas ginsenosidimutans TaxID=862134 RepID=A0A2A4I4D8_9SPHN|nr:cytochrome c maturation protein CcmE [Sphingomonas ginsenosidimutans]PCG10795.1 cytochrome c maturation protein CcmE [Sphingomonas ginsenosidimutans]
MTAKNQRLMLVVLALAALGAAAVLALSGLKDQAAFFYAPSDVAGGLPAPDKAVRLGGMVQKASIRRAADGVSIAFVVTDGRATTPVTFSGIAPDLFREGSGVVAEGHFRPDASFAATNLLAKHDEKYMPPQMAGKMHETTTLKDTH